ncbi:MAG: type II secretion system F family protein [Candidatus Heimdallarchaeota archaeon]|nr:type II secretion system F family protein [Candidatus Heimdallarchaeota archaeon]MDH5645225.1 type II secretion system F family protein [Candidatus Heimdallarchaeota archaeon]
MSKEFNLNANDLRKRNRTVSRNGMIWIFALILSLSFFLIGYLDFQADYEQRIAPTYFDRNGNVATNSTMVVDYTQEDGSIVQETFYPVFGKVYVPKPEGGGFLPAFIDLSIHEWIAVSLIVLFAIPAFMIYLRENKRLDGIDNNLPYLLREIADSQRIGMQLPRAIAEAAKRNYGPLTQELKKLASKISWGIPFPDAMSAFRMSVDTPLSRQATILILEAERSGGELEKIFDSAQTFVQELLDVKKERESSIKPYVYIVFISYLIFIVVVYVLFTTFFAPFGSRSITTSDGESVVPVPLQAFKVLFLYLLLVQGFFSGLVAGKMGKGKVMDGTLYSTILMFIGLLFHKFLIVASSEKIEEAARG